MITLLISLLLSVQAFSYTKKGLKKINPLSARAFLVNDHKGGDLTDLQVEIKLQEGFFAYHDRFRLKALNPKDLPIGEINIDPIIEFLDTTGKAHKKKKGIKGKATIKTQVQLPDDFNGDSPLKMALTYIACTKKYCLTPRTIEFAVKSKSQFKKLANVPSPPKQSSQYIQSQIETNFTFALLLIFFFGILTSLTPCIYPLIPITLAVLGADSKERNKLSSFLISFVYVQGIGLTYSLLGVIAAQTGQLFGAAISHPVVVIFMSLIFFIMGLSLLGLFEIQAPAFIRNRASGNMSQKGYFGAFIAGLIAGIIASPCVGPVLVGVLAYIAKTQNSFLGFILLYTFAMGFGLLILAIGTFSQLANKLPRSGAWMNTVKTLLAFALFAMSFYYVWPLVKPLLPESAQTKKMSTVEWQTFHPDKIIEAQKNGQPVIIDFYADWCAACVEMDQFTFSKKSVGEMSRQFMMLKVDATTPFDELNDWQIKYKVYGLPTMIFIDKDGKVLEDLTLTGFEEAPLFIQRMKKAIQPE